MKVNLLGRLGVAGLVLATSGVSAEAAGFEVAVFTGPAIPTYKQSFTFSSGSPQFQFARLNVREEPTLDAKGGLSLGFAATLFLSDSFGLEGRIDSIDLDLQSFGGSYTLELGPAGSPISSLPVTLGTGATDLRRVRPMSLNLRVQSQGRVGLGLSAGVSYLPELALDAQPTLSVANLNATVPVSLVASPVNPDETRHLGLNAGVTLQIRIAGGFSLVGEARGFAFRRSELKWESQETGALGAVEEEVLGSIASRLEIPRFTPAFWTARAGLALRF